MGAANVLRLQNSFTNKNQKKRSNIDIKDCFYTKTNFRHVIGHTDVFISFDCHGSF